MGKLLNVFLNMFNQRSDKNVKIVVSSYMFNEQLTIGFLVTLHQ